MQSVWGSDCTSFRPERWFVAFNASPRTCLGKDMAYFLMKAVASMILFHFKIILVPEHKVLPKLSVTLYLKYGLLVTLEPHDPK